MAVIPWHQEVCRIIVDEMSDDTEEYNDYRSIMKREQKVSILSIKQK